MLRLAAPLTLGALSGIFCERSGVVNIAIEGMMLTSAFFAFVFALYMDNMLAGVLAGLIVGLLMALLHGVLSIRYKVDQIISGTVINILAVGVTGYLHQQLFQQNMPGGKGTFAAIKIPLLGDIPNWGTIFHIQPIALTAIILVFVTHVILFYTPWGLRTRAVGEHPGRWIRSALMSSRCAMPMSSSVGCWPGWPDVTSRWNRYPISVR